MTGRKRVVVVGAGVAGLAAAIRLARRGLHVVVLDARKSAGGLASGFEMEGLRFDGGPYILLDRPGLDWAFRSLGIELGEHVVLRKIDDVYEVESVSARIRFHADLERTALGFEDLWPGSGKRYVAFVRRTGETYRRLEPMLRVSRPSIGQLVRHGLLGCAPFLLRSLGSVLEAADLPRPLVDAIGIWTHVAAQPLREAPSPMAFVPSLIHTVGAFYPDGGISNIPLALSSVASAIGVDLRFGAKVRSVRCEADRAVGIETVTGEIISADAVVSSYNGIGTYLELLSSTPERDKQRLGKLPLQSPGLAAYLAVRGELRPPYLRFQLPDSGKTCRLLIQPSVLDPTLARDGWSPARLLSPMAHDLAERLGSAGQKEHLEAMIAEDGWRKHVSEFRILSTRVPAEWGVDHHLYRNSMNPVMTARFMRRGRLPHRSPYVRGLYLAGSSTHPGQWVSFCAISGVLAADLVHEDLARA